jgi:hypothetical protein
MMMKYPSWQWFSSWKGCSCCNYGQKYSKATESLWILRKDLKGDTIIIIEMVHQKRTVGDPNALEIDESIN